MKKAIFKGIILGIIFTAALMLISAVMNQGNTDMTTEMAEPSYPIVSMSAEGYRVNSLHGYAEAMDSAYLRETVQPVGSDRKLAVHLDTYGRSISGISFEVRSLNGDRLVESTNVEEYERSDEAIDFTITLKDLIEYDTEYMLVFLITPEGAEPIHCIFRRNWIILQIFMRGHLIKKKRLN